LPPKLIFGEKPRRFRHRQRRSMRNRVDSVTRDAPTPFF
jgi:hypothetical protein